MAQPTNRLEDLGLSASIVSMLRDKWNIKKLFPPQLEALPHSLKGNNVMLTIPTASGKSLIAHLTIVHRLTNDLIGSRALYIVPLKALAQEKMVELSEIASVVGLKVGLAIGDRDGEINSLENSDIIVCTSEKLDSLIRSKSEIMNNIGIIVTDEFHLLNDFGRGPTLEIVLSRIRHHKPEVQIIALSATVGNSEELAKWLNAKLIKSHWRPVSLEYGILNELEVSIHKIDSNKKEKIPKNRVIEGIPKQKMGAILDETVKLNGQLLIFVSSRASAQKEARDLANYVIKMSKKENSMYAEEHLALWEELSESLTNNDEKSALGKKLKFSLKGGIGFHHAGLSNKHRKKIEKAFKSGDINCIVATPTLAQGVNLPARRVVIRDHKRWNTLAGTNIPISVMEIRQMMGRAGRPKYDNRGEAWIISKSKQEVDTLVNRYITSDSEDIVSKLANPNALKAEEDPALLTHVLSMIATGGIEDRDSLSKFFSMTFLSTHMDSEELAERIDDSISWLADNGMISREGDSDAVKERMLKYNPVKKEEKWIDDVPAWVNSASNALGIDISKHNNNNNNNDDKNKKLRTGPAIFGFTKASNIEEQKNILPESSTMTYKATNLGIRISRLYLNPISGRIIRDGLERAMAVLLGEDKIHQISPLGLIYLVCCTPDFLPIWPRASDFEIIQSAVHNHSNEILVQPNNLDEGQLMKGTLVLESWIDEFKFEDIEEKWNVQPGDLRSRVELAEWLLYATRRILAEDQELRNENKDAHKTLFNAIDEVYRRIKYGCKSDLLGLVSIKGVGRTRAREVINKLGISNVNDVIMMTDKDRYKLADLWGWSENLVNNIINSAERLVKNND
ncbi:MAG: helicase [Candidatus Thalassarchaeaceae archaeon]|jgi:helicase